MFLAVEKVCLIAYILQSGVVAADDLSRAQGQPLVSIGAAVRFSQHLRPRYTRSGAGEKDRVASQSRGFSLKSRQRVRFRLPAQQHPTDQALFAEYGAEQLAIRQASPVRHDPDRPLLSGESRRASGHASEQHRRYEPSA